MAANIEVDHDSSGEDEFSDDEFWQCDVGDMDLVELTEGERAEVARAVRNVDNVDSSDSEPSGDELDDDNVPLFFRNPRFEWTRGNFVAPDRVTFSQRPGPTRVVHTRISASQCFGLFYSDHVFGTIVTYTNNNAAKKKREDPDNNKGEWKNVTLKEIKAFYGIVIMMDIMRLDRDYMYWDTGTKYHMLGTNIAKVMSRDRFFQIRRYLHFCDPATPVNAGDKLHKIRFMIDTMRSAFMSEYNPHKQVTVDEAMVPFKGRLSIKQYMKDKPVKFGIKIWVAADSVTAYCFNFEVYVGRNGDQVKKIFGLSSKVVVSLTQSFQQSGREIYTDNFYTSPMLGKYLLSKGIYLCGTVRTDRTGFPKSLVKKKKDVKRLERGHTEWLECQGMVATAWKDKRMVYYISTCHAPEQEGLTAQRRQKDGTAIQLNCTPTVTAYSQYMGGVDRLDQMTRLNKSKKTMKWYRRLERKLLELSLYNSYVIRGHVTEGARDGEYARQQPGFLFYKLDVAHELVGTSHLDRPSVGRPRSDANNITRLDRLDHLAVKGEGRDHGCVVCYMKHVRYRDANPGTAYSDNPFKRRKSVIKCHKCDVYLCCNESNCFFEYHTQVQL